MDITHLQFVGFFALGMVAQAFFMMFGQWEKGDLTLFALSFGSGLLGMMPGKREKDYDLGLHLFFACGVIAFTFASLFRKRLLTRTGARSLLIINVILIYSLINDFGFSYIILAIAAIPTIITLVNGFTNIDNSFNWQVFFYAWFLIMVIAIGALNFPFSDLNIFGFSNGAFNTSPIEMIFTGAAFFYIVTKLWYILALSPIQGKHESRASWEKRVEEQKQLLAYGYIRDANDILGNAICILFLPMLLFINYKFKLLGVGMVASGILALLPVLSYLDGSNCITHDGIGCINK